MVTVCLRRNEYYVRSVFLCLAWWPHLLGVENDALMVAALTRLMKNGARMVNRIVVDSAPDLSALPVDLYMM